MSSARFPPSASAPRALPVRPWCVTARTDLGCSWCEYCGGPAGRDFTPGSPEQPPFPENEAMCARLVGGDPFTHGDLAAWVRWAKRHPRTVTEAHGHGHHLADPGVIERVIASGVDAIRVLVPSLDDARLEAWTGQRDVSRRTLAGIDLALDRDLPVTCVVAVNTLTLPTLADTVTGLAERFEGRVPIVLQRAPVRPPRRPDVSPPPPPWDELTGLGEALASLPRELPYATPLRFDSPLGYAPCVVPREAWRPGLFELQRGSNRSLESSVAPDGPCAECAWRPRCAWRLPPGTAPVASMRALTDDDVSELLALTHEPKPLSSASSTRAETLRAYGLPDLLCFAPFTSMSIHELRKRPVPCAQSWVDTTSTPEMEAEALGVPLEEIVEKNRISQAKWGVPWHDVMNEDWPLRAIWNAPLLQHMRRQMIRGGASDRCRSSCRVVLGVEERGTAFLQRPDDELDPLVVANRRLLLDDMNAMRPELQALPLDLCVGVSSHCNISCGFCTGPMGRYGELSERRYGEVVELLPTLMHLSAVGPGEPLMSAGFQRLLGHIADRGYPSLTVSVTTNGTLVRKRWIERHKNVRWGLLRVSLNAGTPEAYERMTGKRGLFESTLEGIELLAEHRDARREPFELILSCVLSTNVLGELGAFAALAHRYRAGVVLEPMTGDLDGKSPYKTAETIRRLGEECRAVADEYAAKNPPLARAFLAMSSFADERTKKRLHVILPRR